MLTSHEFMLANKKRRNDNQTQSKGNDRFSNGNSHGNSDGNYQHQGQNRDSRHAENHQNTGYRRQRSPQHGQQNFQQNFQKPQYQQEYDSGYVPEVIEGHVYEGIVQNYYREKGYGFIRSEEFKVPAFFHYSEIQLDGFKYLIKQQKVEFKARVSDDGKLQAYEVTPTELAPTQKRQIFNKDPSGSDE